MATGGAHAFLWTAEDGMIDLGTLGGTRSYARGINDLGQVVGESSMATGGAHAFLWTAEGGMIDLGTLGGARSSAWGINNLGQVVGESSMATGGAHAFLWTAEDGMTDLGSLGGLSSAAYGINNLGQVVGEGSYSARGHAHAFLWAVPATLVTPVTIVTPEAAIADAVENVTALVAAGTLSDGEATALTAKLDAARHQLDKDNTKAATSVLKAFINQVGAMVNSGRLTAEEARSLIDSVNTAIELIEA